MSLASKLIESINKINEADAEQKKIERIALDIYTQYKDGDHFVTDSHAIEDKLSLAGLSTDLVDAVYNELRNVFGMDV